MTSPTFSVATPTRNALDKLKRCVGSVRGQTGVSWEHLVQDACSTDGSVAWLMAQQGLQAVSEPDAGMYDAIGRAWARSSGEVLSWLNADEQYLPGTLAAVAAFFQQHPQVDAVFGNYIVCDGEGRPIALRREIPFRAIYVRNTFLYAASCTTFFRRRLYDQGLLRFEPRWRYAADKDLMLKLAAAGARIAHLDRYLGLFGIDGSNLSTHPRMAEEAEEVRRAHGALPHHWLRLGPLLARRVERWWRKGYRPQAVEFAYALDERPVYRTQMADRLGGRYALSDAAKE